jgi:hypothetical protein
VGRMRDASSILFLYFISDGSGDVAICTYQDGSYDIIWLPKHVNKETACQYLLEHVPVL